MYLLGTRGCTIRHLEKFVLCFVAIFALFSGAANATFTTQANGVVLDTATGLEWEQNANHGPFTWTQASAYATGLTLDAGGWRLPATANELFDLYSDIFALGGCNGTDCRGDQSPFTDIQAKYWTNDEFTAGAVRTCDFIFGGCGGDLETIQLWVWAVRDSVPAVPEPETYAMLLAGLGLLGFIARRRKKITA